MFISWRSLPQSHKLLCILVVCFFLNIIAQGLLSHMSMLIPGTLFSGEIWRFVAYPFFDNSSLSIAFSSAVLFFFAPELEDFMGSKRFVIVSALFLVLHAALFCLVPTNAAISLQGVSALATAVFTAYIYLYPKAEVSLFGLLTFRAWIIGMLWLSYTIFRVAKLSMPPVDMIVVFLSRDFLGVMAGITFAHVAFERTSLMPSMRSRRRPMAAESRKRSYEGVEADYEDPYYDYDEAPAHGKAKAVDKEERLNEILDKINDKGKASLSREEIEFLQSYSKEL